MAIFCVSIRHSAWLFGLLCLAGCGLVGPTATPTPSRQAAPAALHVTQAEGARWRVTLDALRYTPPEGDSAAQWLAIVAAPEAPPAYVLFPSNQPDIDASTVDLSAYPLHISSEASGARVWVLALRHTAYPVIDTADAAERIAAGFAARGPSLAEIVAADAGLLAWFGQVTLLESLTAQLGAEDTWWPGENRVQGEALTLGYALQSAQAPPPPTATPAPAPTDDTPSVENWRLVIDEDFTGGESAVTWFTGQDDFYQASLIEGAYQITLTQIDPARGDIALSWGSIQALSFDDYIVRARMRVLEPDILARYGLWLHYQDDFNFLFFGLETSGRFRVARFQNSYTELHSWAASEQVNRAAAENVMEVRLMDEEYTLSLNGTPVVVTTDASFVEGRIAFFCYAESVPATCQLRSLQVWVPSTQPFPRPTHTPTE